MAAALSFDLVVATVDRTKELAALLEALAAQTHPQLRLVLVDQNDDDRVERLLDAHPTLTSLHLRAPRGLSRARNAALPHLAADLVAFPDDDCLYPPDLLSRVALRFAGDDRLDGLSGRPVAADGRSVGRWPTGPERITLDTVWHRANSHTIFLRSELVENIGTFDEALGLGSGTPWASGEEIDYLARALRFGARVEYDPSIEITHPVKAVTREELVALGRRDGASVGYVLARNRYPIRTVARMLVRPAVGSLVSLVLLHRTRARFHAATLVGRISGLRAGSRA
ncbi:MAG TPA: glycosyltransferase family A protein [Gaiella sp.]|uniref:glycosyltransferase family 2 protein n=1 Tax=Gaiella sp. TaxID=2663207 RepID=UPI002D7F5555|nr:glycosyltransferase family A protein [Gaiella sp.]HET9289200.1 glycosyltransferase family A protein [Gaiella sp.]